MLGRMPRFYLRLLSAKATFREGHAGLLYGQRRKPAMPKTHRSRRPRNQICPFPPPPRQPCVTVVPPDRKGPPAPPQGPLPFPSLFPWLPGVNGNQSCGTRGIFPARALARGEPRLRFFRAKAGAAERKSSGHGSERVGSSRGTAHASTRASALILPDPRRNAFLATRSALSWGRECPSGDCSVFPDGLACMTRRKRPGSR